MAAVKLIEMASLPLLPSEPHHPLPVPTVSKIKTALLNLSTTQRLILKTVCRLFQLLLQSCQLQMPRSFSALRRIKSYLMSKMTQARLNLLMILHYYQEMTDSLDLKSVGNEYISKGEARKSICYVLVLTDI